MIPLLTSVISHTWPHSLQKGLQLPLDSAHYRRPPVGEGCVQLHQGGPRPDLLQRVLPTADTTNPNDGDAACREAQGDSMRKDGRRENQELRLASALSSPAECSSSGNTDSVQDPGARATHKSEDTVTDSLPWVSAYISRMVCVAKSRRGFPLSPPVSERRAPWRPAGRLTVVFVTISPSMPSCSVRQRKEASSCGTDGCREASLEGLRQQPDQAPAPTAPEARPHCAS